MDNFEFPDYNIEAMRQEIYRLSLSSPIIRHHLKLWSDQQITSEQALCAIIIQLQQENAKLIKQNE